MIVSPALSLMLTLGGVLVPPDGCTVVAVYHDGHAVAACADPHAWFVYNPELTHAGMWSLTHTEPPGLPSFPDPAAEGVFEARGSSQNSVQSTDVASALSAHDGSGSGSAWPGIALAEFELHRPRGKERS